MRSLSAIINSCERKANIPLILMEESEKNKKNIRERTN